MSNKKAEPKPKTMTDYAFTVDWSKMRARAHHLENKALFLLSQEMKLEINRINQTTDDLPVELLLDQEIQGTEIEQEE